MAEVGALYLLVLRPATYLTFGMMRHQTLFSITEFTYLSVVSSESLFFELKSHSESVKGVTQFLLESGKKCSCGSI